MRTVVIIQARMGSTRLPDKVLMPVLGKPLLGWMLERMSSCVEVTETIVATTTDPRDDVIAAFAQGMGCRVFRGSEDDVLDRYYQAARMAEADAVARITADCPLLDPAVLDMLVREFKQRGLDFISNSEPLPSSWPDGMDVSVMSFAALEKAWYEARKPSEREHVTFHFWNHPEAFKCERIDHVPDGSGYRMTIDYPEDFLLIQAVIEHFSSTAPGPPLTPLFPLRASMEDITRFLDAHPEIAGLNAMYVRGLGWQAAFERDRQQGPAEVAKPESAP